MFLTPGQFPREEHDGWPFSGSNFYWFVARVSALKTMGSPGEAGESQDYGQHLEPLKSIHWISSCCKGKAASARDL